MNRSVFATTVFAALAVGAGIYAALKFSDAQRGNAALAELERQHAEMSARLAKLESMQSADAKKAQAVAADNTLLQAALVRAQQAQAEKAARAAAPMTRAELDERFRRAQTLARNGDPAEALAELQWCWSEGLKRVNSAVVPARLSGLASAFGELASRYPPALTALRERRDDLRARVLAGPGGSDAVAEFATVLRALKEQPAILDVFDQVPPGDKRRSTLGIYGFDQLLEARRYADAMEGHSYGAMVSEFAVGSNDSLPANLPNADRIRESRRNFVVNRAIRNVEALAGAGDLEHARMLAEKVMAFDSSDATRASIQEHAARAGQPNLLSAPPKP